MVRGPTSRRRLNPFKAHSAKSSASTNTSITRTGLLSSMKSSRHSGSSVRCPRSASSTKRLINSPAESRENHSSSTVFSHNQGHSRRFRDAPNGAGYPPIADIRRWRPSAVATTVTPDSSSGCVLRVGRDLAPFGQLDDPGLDPIGSCRHSLQTAPNPGLPQAARIVLAALVEGHRRARPR